MIRLAPGKTASLWMTHLRGSLIASVLTGLLVLSGLTSCAVNPATGGANLVLMSESARKSGCRTRKGSGQPAGLSGRGVAGLCH